MVVRLMTCYLVLRVLLTYTAGLLLGLPLLSQQDGRGERPLHLAAALGDYAVTSLQLNACAVTSGARTNFSGRKAPVAIQWPSRGTQPPVSYILGFFGLLLRDSNVRGLGKLPEHCARDRGHTDVAPFLQRVC